MHVLTLDVMCANGMSLGWPKWHLLKLRLKKQTCALLNMSKVLWSCMSVYYTNARLCYTQVEVSCAVADLSLPKLLEHAITVKSVCNLPKCSYLVA